MTCSYRANNNANPLNSAALQGKLAQLTNEARRMKLEILRLSEVRWPNFGEHRIPSGQILLYSGLRGEHAPRHRGVGFLLSAQAHSALMKWEPISERIIVARFRTRVRNLTIIQTYAPTDATDLQDKKNFYSQLNATVDRIPKGDIMICMGDFNAKNGFDNSNYERIMGRHGLGEMSENGELFAVFCGNNDMVIGESLFPHRPDLVHVALPKIKLTTSASAESGNGAFLMCGINLVPISRLTTTSSSAKYVCVLRVFVDKRSELDGGITHADYIPEGGSVEDQWTAIKNAFIVTSENNLGELRTQRKQWITDETWTKIEERRGAKTAI
ncbi:craniofacial development protein 2-like [Malaya genurostris]|uniref:craniofacial development protein 2-like n=1 Tax=Malaya genurostris TaxID=325434 RepID=UPI0026F3F5E4|nr:craniofacial development protein 2-like [Malaya genurostris]